MPMASINGVMRVIAAKTILFPLVTFLLMSSDRKIWITMVRGVTLRNMAPSGYQTAWDRAGHLTPMEIGFGSIPGDGLGKIMLLGDLLRFTTVAG